MTIEEKTKTILLVEDEGILALAEAKMLQNYGFKVIMAPSGEKAIETIQTSPEIDLILMDINLGSGMDGTQAAELILAQRDMPLIFLSSHTEPEVVKKTESITSYGYIVKNSGETVLVASIKMAFRLFEAKQKEMQKEDALRESEEKYRSLFENINEAVVLHEIITDEDGKPIDFVFLDCNPMYEQVTLLKADEIIGKRGLDVIPNLEQSWIDVYGQVALTGKSTTIIDHFNYLDRYWEVKAYSPKERLFAVALTDITERLQAENELMKNQLILEQAERLSSQGGWEWNIIEDKWSFSTNWLQLHGVSGSGISKNELMKIAFPDDAEMVEKALQHALAGLHPYQLEHRIVRQNDGEVRTIKALGKVIFDDNQQPVKMFGSAQDITDRKRAEENLRKYENIISSAPDPIAFLDKEYRYHIVNDAYEKFSATRREKFIGLTVAEYLGEDVFQKIIKPQFDRCLEGEIVTYQEWFEYPTLGRKFVEVTYFPYRDDQNRIAGVVSTTKDITERVQAEEKLRFQADLLDSVEQAVIVTDKDGYVIYWNPFAEQLIGWSAEEALGKNTIDLIDSEQSQQQSLEIMASLGTEKNWSGEYPVRHRDGSLLHVYTTVTPIYNDQRELSYIVGVSSDITERKQAEDELERFFNLIPDMVCIASTDGYFKKLNKEWERVLGYAQNELLAVPFSDFIHPEDREKTFREVERQIAGQHTIHFTNRYRAQDGRYHWFEWNATPSPDGNLLFAAARDITERVQSEHALQEAFEEKQNLLRELQHRAKNSFSLISSLTSLMTDSARGEETRVLLNELSARVRAMSQLYDLLYITEAVAETKLNIYFEQITASFPSTENIRFKQSYETVSVPVKTAAALGLVVTELITNAMKHAFPGNKQGLISISLRKSDTGARIEVTDEGVGFSDGFDLASSHTLGLTIVQSLTQQIQGNFQIEHSKGTRCIVEFPLG